MSDEGADKQAGMPGRPRRAGDEIAEGKGTARQADTARIGQTGDEVSTLMDHVVRRENLLAAYRRAAASACNGCGHWWNAGAEWNPPTRLSLAAWMDRLPFRRRLTVRIVVLVAGNEGAFSIELNDEDRIAHSSVFIKLEITAFVGCDVKAIYELPD